jgi:hypothetical protein
MFISRNDTTPASCNAARVVGEEVVDKAVELNLAPTLVGTRVRVPPVGDRPLYASALCRD